MKVDLRQDLPDGLLGLMAHELHRQLPGPTLVHLPGRLDPPLFLTVLQHGNETTGWEALRAWLAGRPQPLPRSLLLFIANPMGAKDHRRVAEGLPDLNRCWPGHGGEEGEVHRMLAELTDHVGRLKPFASVDIHNNSGRNPHYGAMTRLQPQWLNLARMFDRRAVFFQQPPGVQCEALSRFCPSITVECGLAGLSEGVPHCRDYIDRLMRLDTLPSRFDQDLDLYHTIARVAVREELVFAFGRSRNAPVHFRIDLDALNFLDLPAGTPLAEGELKSLDAMFEARDWHGNDVLHEYFEISDGALRMRKPSTLSMLSRRPEIVRQDCFCYIMERYPTPKDEATPGCEEGKETAQPSILNETRNVPV